MPLAIEQFDLSAYDLILSSSHAVAKGVITGANQLHICYCHSPIRYVWDLTHQYLRESGLTKGLKGWLAKYILHRLRIWDARTANGVDEFIANSHYIARRIKKTYGRAAEVIYPPVEIDKFALRQEKEDFYFTLSRMVPYKKINMIVEAFSGMPEKRLIVAGDGPDFKKIRALAGPNVELVGYQPTDAIIDYMQRAKAFVFAAEEDFGIVPVEAQACGTPVIAYGRGGALETVISGISGLFFDEQTPESLRDAIARFEKHYGDFDPSLIRANALQFSADKFRENFRSFASEKIKEFEGTRFHPHFGGTGQSNRTSINREKITGVTLET
jgi:glycosyltransferase involved in cell wall biosynthesis